MSYHIEESPLATEPGLYRMPDSLYHSQDCAARMSVGATTLKLLDSHCPAVFKAKLDGVRADDSEALSDGRLVHLAVLEPGVFRSRVYPKEHDLRTKAGKEWRSSLPDDAVLVSPAKHLQAVEMAQRVWDRCGALIENSSAEVAAFAPVASERWWGKGKYDLLPADSDIIWDLKTAESARKDRFASAVDRYGYHIQAAHYLAVAQALRLPHRRFGFLVVEKTPPYETALYVLDDDALDHGRWLAERCYEEINVSMASNRWRGYQTGQPETLGLPERARFLLEQRRELER